MKTQDLVNRLKTTMLILVLILGIFSISNLSGQESNNPSKKKKIKIALLLDTSNSMDGLIEQAKSQLWTIVNELATARCDNTKPDIEIALYEYGNDYLTSKEGFIRMVTPLTTDLDEISKDLFELQTNGGSEFCGYVINTAIAQLDWSESTDNLQLIFIAGNEPFTQGNIDYKKSCLKAKNHDIIVNTIFCGNFKEGINTNWKDGADITNGNYMSIEQNRKTVYIETPYDKDITSLNEKLNDTYISYGSLGRSKKANQAVQDNNALLYGNANSVKRIISKSSHVYRNESWDLVDAMQTEEFEIDKVSINDLPEEMKSMNKQEKEEYIEVKTKERKEIQIKIQELDSKRKQYIADNNTESENEGMLDRAMITAIREQALTKNFTFVE